MALGEWIFVQSSRDLYEKQLKTERMEIEEEAEGLKVTYQAKGIPLDQAAEMARQSWRTLSEPSRGWPGRSSASIPTTSG